MDTTHQSGLRILRIRDVRTKTGLVTSSIYAKMAKGAFPKPAPLGDRAVAWIEAEIDAWILAQRATRDRTVGAAVA